MGALTYIREFSALIRPDMYQALVTLLNPHQKPGQIIMREFHRRQFVFVHVPKAGGTSMSWCLYPTWTNEHRRITEYRQLLSEENFNNYFKFAFVRNPWDRLFSAYNFLRKGGSTKNDRRWAQKNIYPYRNFDEFVKTGLTQPEIQQYLHFIPQYEFLYDPSHQSMPIDFLGYFENMQRDFEYIKDKLSLNVTLGHANRSSYRQVNYMDFYTDDSINVVAEVYKKDIEDFGYDFDNSMLKH